MQPLSRKKKTGENDPSDDAIDGDVAVLSPIHDDMLRGWMSGSTALAAWLEEDPADRPTFYSRNLDDKELDDEIAERLRDREEEMARLRRMLGNGDDIDTVLEENARLRKEVEKLTRSNSELMSNASADLEKREAALRERENALNEREKGLKAPDTSELEQRYHAELAQKEMEHRFREDELARTVERLENDLKRKALEERAREDELKLAKLSKSEASKEVQEKLRHAQEKERRALELQDAVNHLNDTISEKDDELKGLKEIVSYKEQELTRREEDLLYRENLITEEKRRMEEAKRSAGGLAEAELKKRLEELRSEVDRREKELKAKEDFLRSKESELRQREMGAIEEELKTKDQEIALETDSAKVKTGSPRLDDLLLGGIPFGSNILMYGPPFVGKETMVNQFIAEGLKKGIPAIWVTTDKTPVDIREEMKLVLPQYEEYEALGLVRYVDSYSRSMGDVSQDKYTTYIDVPTAHDQIMDAVEEVAKMYKEKHEYYRLAFRTISTLIAYSDPNTAFRFLSPFCGRRKRDRAVTMYTIEKGMHGEQEIQMLGSIMDGMIDFKIEQLKTFFMVKGITDVQSRSYIRYNATRHGLSIGSFALDHIK